MRRNYLFEALQIRPSKYRGVDGFVLSGNCQAGNVSIFVRKKETAEKIRDVYRRDGSQKEIRDLILGEDRWSGEGNGARTINLRRRLYLDESSSKRMLDYDWHKIIDAIGGKVRNIDRQAGTVTAWLNKHGATFVFSENAGELNISKLVRVGDSVPYWDNTKTGGAVGDITLAYRVRAEIDGDKIDYDADLDSEITEPEMKDMGYRTRPDVNAAKSYIKKIRNAPKKAYAQAYVDWAIGGHKGKEPDRKSFGGLSYIGAQAVRIELHGLGFHEGGM